MECISTSSVFVLVNRSPTEEFSIKRGLRQGYPLSSFLIFDSGQRLKYNDEFFGRKQFVSWLWYWAA